jgi:hypothetical protein
MEQMINNIIADELLPSAPTCHKPMLADGSFSLSDERVLALSWKQPFASAMLVGKVETRSWNTNYRGLVLICSSKKVYSNDEVTKISGIPLRDEMYVELSNFYKHSNYRNHSNYEYHGGIALAVARLVDCRPMKIEDEEKTFVKFNPNLYCHFYEDVKQIEPFYWKGCQGWKEVSNDVKSSIVFL